MSGPVDSNPAVRYVLVVGKLSLAALAELAKRVRDGEDETTVRVEILEREGKAVRG